MNAKLTANKSYVDYKNVLWTSYYLVYSHLIFTIYYWFFLINLISFYLEYRR